MVSRHVRGSELGRQEMMEVILLPRPGYTGLSRPLWTEAETLTRSLEEISGRNLCVNPPSLTSDSPLVSSDGIKYGWLDLCLKFNGDCVDNTFLSLAQSARLSESEELEGLSYPISRDPVRDFIFHPLLTHLGGVETQDQVITGARAMKLTFMLDDSTRLKRRASRVFINVLNKYLRSLELQTANLTILNPMDVETELIDNIQTAFENNFQLIVIVICAFTIYSCMRSDWVRAKPLLGVAGLLSIILAAFSGGKFHSKSG